MSSKGDIFRDLIPVVGSGFAWRSIAGEAIAFLPFAAGAVPRVAIAFAGTYATGRAVDSYYRFGKRPTKDQINGYYRHAMKIVREKVPGKRALPAKTAAPIG